MAPQPHKKAQAEASPTSECASHLILDHQRAAFNELLAIGRACFAINWKEMPLRPRTNTLVIGPSGSGKTFLARELARELDVPFLHIAVSEWIPLGSSERGSKQTWPVIFNFLRKNSTKPGVIIFLDELDKLFGETTWIRYLQTECYGLLDLQPPSSCDDEEEGSPAHIKVTTMLQTRTLIVGAGAFQHLWDRPPKPALGFGAEAPKPVRADLSRLAHTLPREFVNRFRSRLVVLPQLEEGDYRRMLKQTAPLVPLYLRNTFSRIGAERIHEAVRCRQGCRFVEEVLLDTLIAERAAVSVPPPTVSKHKSTNNMDPQ